MAQLVSEHMMSEGTKFLRKSVPVSIEKDNQNHLLKVTWKDKSSNQEFKDTFNTVLVAIGMIYKNYEFII